MNHPLGPMFFLTLGPESAIEHDTNVQLCLVQVRDWSLITGRGGGGLQNRRGVACEVLPL